MEYRVATTEDVPLLAGLNKQLIEDEQHRNAMSIEELAERMARWLANGYRATIFLYNGEVIGYTLFRHEPDHVYIRQFFIARQYRRRGFGRETIEWLRGNAWKDFRRFRLDVLIGNERAIAFWRSVGFQEYCVTMEAVD